MIRLELQRTLFSSSETKIMRSSRSSISVIVDFNSSEASSIFLSRREQTWTRSSLICNITKCVKLRFVYHKENILT